jgi:phosphoserine phosphatase RsbU/P
MSEQEEATREPQRLRCAEVWGGIDRADTELCSGALEAALFSSAHHGVRGGDIYYLSVCGHDRLTRIVIADVAGHGPVVSKTAEMIYQCLLRHMNEDDGGSLLAELNRDASALGIRAITTAAVLGIYTEDADLRLAYAGHPPALICRRGASHWEPAPYQVRPEPSADIPLAVLDIADYQQQRTTLGRGDRMFIYTDGVLDAPTPDGGRLGLKGLIEVLDAGEDGESVGALKGRVIEAMALDEEGQATHDDVTFLALEVSREVTSDGVQSPLTCAQ